MHCWVSLYHCVLILLHRTLNSIILIFQYFPMRYLGEELRFLHCGVSNSILAIVAICKASGMSDCCSSTQPPSLAIVANMANTYGKLIASKNEILL